MKHRSRFVPTCWLGVVHGIHADGLDYAMYTTQGKDESSLSAMTWVVASPDFHPNHHRHPAPSAPQPLSPPYITTVYLFLLESYRASPIPTFHILCMSRSPTASTIQQYGDPAEFV